MQRGGYETAKATVGLGERLACDCAEMRGAFSEHLPGGVPDPVAIACRGKVPEARGAVTILLSPEDAAELAVPVIRLAQDDGRTIDQRVRWLAVGTQLTRQVRRSRCHGLSGGAAASLDRAPGAKGDQQQESDYERPDEITRHSPQDDDDDAYQRDQQPICVDHNQPCKEERHSHQYGTHPEDARVVERCAAHGQHCRGRVIPTAEPSDGVATGLRRSEHGCTHNEEHADNTEGADD